MMFTIAYLFWFFSGNVFVKVRQRYCEKHRIPNDSAEVWFQVFLMLTGPIALALAASYIIHNRFSTWQSRN